MYATRRFSIITGALLAAGATLPASVSLAADVGQAPVLAYELAGYVPAVQADLATASDDTADAGQAALDPDAVRCLAKVVHHEAGNQPRAGKIAVAQTLVNRLNAGGRFGDSICAVANQPGQYFATTAYHPDEASEMWRAAVDAARTALSGGGPAVAPGAIFFRAAYSAPTSFFRTRQRIAAVGDHVFYR